MADYTTLKWVQDAVVVKSVYILIKEDGQYSHLKDIFWDSNKIMALSALRIIFSSNVQADIEARAISILSTPMASVNTLEAFTTFLKYFYKGPTKYSLEPAFPDNAQSKQGPASSHHSQGEPRRTAPDKQQNRDPNHNRQDPQPPRDSQRR
jgi:hypothetical protein